MATWVRLGTGTAPTSTDGALTGRYSLDNGTAPGDFDPAGVTSVQIAYMITGTLFDDDDDWSDLRAATLDDGTNLAATVNGTDNNTLKNVGSSTDETDGTPNAGLTTGNWEAMAVSGGAGINGAYTSWNQNKGPDGGVQTMSALTVTITYTPGGTPGSASPDAIARSFTVDAPTVVGPAVDVQSVIARLFTVDAATAKGAGVDVQDVINRSFNLGTDFFLDLPGTSGHFASTPDHASFDGSTTTRLEVRASMVDWSRAGDEQALMGQWSSGGGGQNYLWRLNTSGQLNLFWNGVLRATSTSAVSLIALAVGWLAVDVTQGAGSGVVTFYESTTNTDDSTEVVWSQISTHTSLTIDSITIDSELEVGAQADGAQDLAEGNFYRARLTIDGTLVANFNAADFNIGDSDTDTAVDSTGKTWTINGASSIIKRFPTLVGGGVDVQDVIARSFALDQVTPTNSDAGAGSASPAVTNRVFTVDAVTAKGAGVDVQDVINRLFTVDAVTVKGPAVDLQDLIARSFGIGATTQVGRGVDVQEVIARAFGVNAVTPVGGAIDLQDVIARVFGVNDVTTANSDSGAGTATPDVIARVFTVDAPTLIGGGVDIQDVIARAFGIPAPTPVGAGVDVQDVIARAFGVNDVTLVGPGVQVAPLIARTFGLGAANGSGSAVVLPAAIVRAFTVDAVTLVGPGVQAAPLIALLFVLDPVTLSNSDAILGARIVAVSVVARSRVDAISRRRIKVTDRDRVT